GSSSPASPATSAFGRRAVRRASGSRRPPPWWRSRWRSSPRTSSSRRFCFRCCIPDEHAMSDAAAFPSVRDILAEPGAPVIVFDHVQLAFDEKVVLQDVSFTLLKGHTKIILGASGSGKSTALKIITGLLRADAGVVWVNGQRVDQLTE